MTDAQEISVGEILASARKKKRLRYKKLSSELNIDEIYLIALEEGNFDLIPGGEAYVKGFLRSYAKKLDLNPDDVIDNYLSSRKGSIKAIRKLSPKTSIEILTPDFLRKDGALEKVINAKPDVFNHNLETVPRLYPTVRPGARYFHSLSLLAKVKEIDPNIFTKSGIMVGLGENENEVFQLSLIHISEPTRPY